MQTTLTAPDIECAGCAASIQKALSKAEGVHSVGVKVPSQTITLDYDPQVISLLELKELLTEIGFPTAG